MRTIFRATYFCDSWIGIACDVSQCVMKWMIDGSNYSSSVDFMLLEVVDECLVNYWKCIMTKTKRRPTILVSSSVYGVEELLDRIYAILTSFGYDVWMSRSGTLSVRSDRTAFENCLNAVDKCDLFLGIITTSYGTGIDERSGHSITHLEIKRAIELNKPRWLLTHDQVVFARRFLNDLGHKTPADRGKLYLKKGAKSITDLRVIDMYEDAIRHHIEPLSERYGNWVQEFSTNEAANVFITAQFSRFQEVENFLKENLANPVDLDVRGKQRQEGGK